MTRNNVRSLYPCAEVDMTSMITAGVMSSTMVTIEGEMQTAYLGTFQTVSDPTWITEGITDPRSDRQLVWFNEDHINDCYEEVVLAAEPDDFFVHGVDDIAGTPRDANVTYYTGSQFSVLSPRLTCALDQTYADGTYQYNNSMCCICKTETDYFFGLAFNNVYSPNSWFDYYQFDAWYIWRNNYSGLDESTFTTQPQYGLQTPGIGISPGAYTRTYWVSPGISGDNPETPTNCITELVIGEYNDVTYVGFCFHLIDADGLPTGTLHIWMMPLDFWGEVVPYSPEPPGPDVPEPGDFGPDSTPDAGGSGTYSDTNETPVIPTPTSFVDELGNHGLHLYNIDAANYGALLQELWGNGSLSSTLWSRWQNYKFNPLQGIISSHFIPTELLPEVYATSTSVHVAGVDMLAYVVAPPCKSQIGSYTVGTLSIPEFFGNALDYSPFTQLRLYLPFCGWIEIDPDRVVGGSLSVHYICDAITGDVCAYVTCTDRDNHASYMYTATGNCAFTIPITGNDQGTGQVLSSLSGAVMGAVMGNPLGVAGGLLGAVSAQHHMQMTGSFSGSVSLISDLTCRLQIIRPVQSTPAHGQELRGRPSDIGCLIGDLIGTGWSSFDAVHADIEGATVDECREIERLLHEGVIL